MNGRERVLAACAHRQADRVPVDFGGTGVTGIHVRCVAALRQYYGLEKRVLKAIEPGQMLGEIEEDLKQAMRIDVEGVFRLSTRFGTRQTNWKPFRFADGFQVLVGGDFNTTTDSDGNILMHPQGDVTAAASAMMPRGGHFFDNIIRQGEIDEDKLDPADNLEEFGPIAESEIDYLEQQSTRARATGRAVIAGLGGTSFGDIALVPGAGLKDPKGIRDIAEWYMSTRSRRGYIHEVFGAQCEIALENLTRIAARIGDNLDAVMVCGTDFGTQNSSFCSVPTFRDLWLPYYRQITGWIHKNTKWLAFKHSCGAVEKFLPSFLDAGFDILNPVQCSAAGMQPDLLKERYGDRLTFWGGGVDTQQTLPFGTPAEVREQVLARCETFAKDGGFVFTSVHNVQAGTPVENIVAMIDAIAEFNGR